MEPRPSSADESRLRAAGVEPPGPSPSDRPGVGRREWLGAVGSTTLGGVAAIGGWGAIPGGLVGTACGASGPCGQEAADPADTSSLKGNINHSVVHWCFGSLPVETLCEQATRMGLKSIELIAPEHWPTLARFGLTCAIASSHGFAKGWNHRENWDFCRETISAAITAGAEFGCRRVITFSGMLDGIDPDEGVRNTIDGLKSVVGLAERSGVTLCLEILNTRVDESMKGHPGYQCDTAEWAIAVCDAVGSEHLKILYDIYHQQIMQGDVIARIRQYRDYIGHYHTAGVPGRRELDDRQEINYPAVMRAIVESGYDGFVGHEFIPTWDDPLAALRHAIGVCDV